MVRALFLRDAYSTFSDKGRTVEFFIFPFSFLVIWGLLLNSGTIDRSLGSQILTINFLWSVSYSFQVHVNYPVAFDLWSREFVGILQEGVSHHVMAIARAAFGLCAGMVIFLVGFLGLISMFPVEAIFLVRLVEALPLVLCSSLGLGTAINGVLYYVGRSYNFLSWTIMQFIVVFSSPFTPIERLSLPLRYVAYLSPYSYPFEFIRSGEWSVYWAGLILSLAGLTGGMVIHSYFYNLARKSGKTVTG
jgi:hypothetical protein